MGNTDPKLIILLLVVVITVVTLNLLNPHKKYSTQAYWESATVAEIADIPDEAIQVGNSNGSVLMWAATTVTDVKIIEALVERGADINEVDGAFFGTPLSGAASYTERSEIIDKLIELGADINAKLINNNSILMASAMYNENPGIIDTLVAHGADVSSLNYDGQDALDLAYILENNVAVEQLLKYLDESL